MSQIRPEPSASVTESPWFWVMLFSLAGLAAVCTMGPKFERREAGIEQNFHARERALGREAFDKPNDEAAPQPAPWRPIFTLGPIAAVLICIVVTAMVNVLRFQARRLAAMRRSNNDDIEIRPPGEAGG